MNSDSDSDDDLLLSAKTFAKPNRRQQNKEARVQQQQNSILNEALQNSERMAKYARRLSLAKQQQQQQQHQGENDDTDDDDDDDTNADTRSARRTAKKARRGSTLTSTKKTPSARNGTPASSLGGVYDLDGKDQDEVLPIERRRQLAKAYATEGSSCLGTRMIISFDMEKSVSSSSPKWTSPDQAIQELERILSCFEKENSLAPDIANIVESLRTAIDLSVLPDFLMEKRLVRKLFQKSSSSSMPPLPTTNDDEHAISPLLTQLTTWLYCTATSAGLMMTSNLAQGALVTLMDLVKKGKLPLQMQQSPISYLVAELLCWIDSKDVLQDDMAENESANNDSDCCKNEAATAVPMDIDYPSPHGLFTTKNNNETGLLNLLLFWEQLIPSWSPFPVVDLEAASSVILVLCRLALDPTAVSNRHEMYLFPLLQRVVSAMLDLVSSHFYRQAAIHGGNESESNAAFDEWMDQTVQAVFGQDLAQVGTRLGIKGEKAMDEDDDKASLCYASTVRLIPIHRSDGKVEETHKLSVEFKARLAIRALEILCDNGKEHESKGDTTTIQGFPTDQASQQAQREMPPLAWTAYSAVLSAMGHLNVLGENIARQGPRSLATVECTTMLFETVLILLNGAAESWDKEEYTPEQASVVVEMLQTVDRETEKLNKYVKRNTMANSHARRMDHHFSCWTQYYRVMVKRALRLTGDKEMIERQSKITDFMLSSP
jgi:hypothetical protein